jgi:SAM-dependent methyltransferase
MDGAPTLAGEAKKGWQPYWAELWECSFVVAERLASQDLTGLRLLDVGCGLGLTGSVAAARGARVTMIDAAHPALLFARLNSWPWRQRVQVRRLDWRHDRLAGPRFDWIVGADVVYDRDDWPFLEGFWQNHLLADGLLLLGEGGRSTGKEFVGWLAERGWGIVGTEITDARFHRPIRLLEVRHPRTSAAAAFGFQNGDQQQHTNDLQKNDEGPEKAHPRQQKGSQATGCGRQVNR